MLLERPTRRRAITMLAASAAAVATGFPFRARAEYEWRGFAMGSDARILFSGVSIEDARAAAQMVSAEIERLENALSLFREQSEICRLNSAGFLATPSGDMRRSLALALSVAESTGGLFDPTVQALWEAHVDWFTAAPNSDLPPDAVIERAHTAVDWRRIALDVDLIKLGPGQRVTLNGLGQGYVTDRVADLLRQQGFVHVLVDLGEQRALGPCVDGAPWLIVRRDAEAIALTGGALATSEGEGCVLGAAGAVHHLFDPRTGRSAGHWRRITVRHRSAALADALSTALSAASPTEIEGMAGKFAGITVWATDHRGDERRWNSSPSARL